MNRLIKLFYALVIYSLGVLCYIGLQEFYVDNCTLRAGILNMVFNMPTCSWISSGLRFISQHFISLVISSVALLSGFIF